MSCASIVTPSCIVVLSIHQDVSPSVVALLQFSMLLVLLATCAFAEAVNRLMTLPKRRQRIGVFDLVSDWAGPELAEVLEKRIEVCRQRRIRIRRRASRVAALAALVVYGGEFVDMTRVLVTFKKGILLATAGAAWGIITAAWRMWLCAT
jgi:hypothetical protein